MSEQPEQRLLLNVPIRARYNSTDIVNSIYGDSEQRVTEPVVYINLHT